MNQSPATLVKEISRLYGFKEELINDPHLCGLWHVRFSVNRIKYYGCICHSGAEPCLKVEGYEYKYYDHDCPITEEYYNKYIKGKKLRLLIVNDPNDKSWEEGDWKDTGIRFDTVAEFEDYISRKCDNKRYDYDYEF